jgi:hypothetical protein
MYNRICHAFLQHGPDAFITAVSALPDWNKSSYVYFYNSPYKSDLFRCATSKIMWGEVEKNILSKMDQKIFQSLFDHSTGAKKLYYFCAHDCW